MTAPSERQVVLTEFAQDGEVVLALQPSKPPTVGQPSRSACAVRGHDAKIDDRAGVPISKAVRLPAARGLLLRGSAAMLHVLLALSLAGAPPFTILEISRATRR
jgi:hypothetical protein